MMKNRKGFTIVEVIISLVILVLALFALSSLQTASIGSNASGQQMTIATMMAQDKLEELMALPWDDSQLSDTVDNFVDTNGDLIADYFDWALDPDHVNADGVGGIASPIDENGNNVETGGFTRIWNVVNDTPIKNNKTVSVRVSWSYKADASVTLDCIIARKD